MTTGSNYPNSIQQHAARASPSALALFRKYKPVVRLCELDYITHFRDAAADAWAQLVELVQREIGRGQQPDLTRVADLQDRADALTAHRAGNLRAQVIEQKHIQTLSEHAHDQIERRLAVR